MLRSATCTALCALLLSPASVLDAQEQGDSIVPPQLVNAREVSRTLDGAYPPELQQRRIGGRARMRLFVNAEGGTDTLRLAASTGLHGLDQAARLAAREARFRAGTLHGEPIGAWVDLDVHFDGDFPSPTPRAFTIPDRDERAQGFGAFFPAELKNSQIGTRVGLLLELDATGAVIEHDIVEPSCFADANDAAVALVRTLAFEPPAADSARAWTYATVGFGSDSVRLTLFGDAEPRDTTRAEPRDPDRRRGASRAPELTNRPSVQRALETHYPPLLRARGLGGTVGVHFRLEANGRVSHRVVSTSSGYCELDIAALDVARVMRFRPAVSDGEPVMVWVEIPIIFSAR